MNLRELERGQLLALMGGAAAFLVGLAAYAVDSHYAQQTRAQVEAAAQAGALAASYNLLPPVDEAAVTSTAVTWVGRNGYPITEANVKVWNHPSGRSAVTVRWEQPVPTGLARLIGIGQVNHPVEASAVLGGVKRVPKGAFPLALPARRDADGNWVVQVAPGDYQPLRLNPEEEGGPTPLRLVLGHADDGTLGNAIPLTVSESGGEAFERAIVAGAPNPIAFGTYVPVFDEAPGPAFNRGVGTRLEAGSDSADVAIPLVDAGRWTGTEASVRVIGLMTARLVGQGESGELLAQYSPKVLPDEGALDGDAGAGAYAPVLVDTPHQ